MAQQLINGRQQFIDGNGNPLAGGSVAFYAPGTLNPVNTYQDSGLTTPNANPLTLDASGSAVIWADTSAQYRQIVKDALGNTIWDETVGIFVSASGATTSDGYGNAQASLNARAQVFADYAAVAELTSTYTANVLAVKSADGGVFRYDASDTTSSADGGGFCGSIIVDAAERRWKRIDGVYPTKYGADATGATASETEIQNYLNALQSANGYQNRAFFDPNIGVTISYLTAAGVTIPNSSFSKFDLSGIQWTLSADTTLIDLNPSANPADPNSTLKSMIRWDGGKLINSFSSPTASIGLQVFGVRDIEIKNTWIQGFKNGLVFSSTDTHYFRGLHFYNNDVSLWMKQWQTISPNIFQISTFIENCHFSISGKTTGFLAEEAWTNLSIGKSSFNGDAVQSVWVKDYNPNGTGALLGFSLKRSHFEQGGAGHKYVWLNAANGNGFAGVTESENVFEYSSNLFTACAYEKVTGADLGCGSKFGQTAFNIAGNGTSNGVNVTSASATMTFSGTANTSGLFSGMYVRCAGVPQGTTILSVDSSTQVTLSANATGTFAFTHADFNVATPILLDANCSNIVIARSANFSSGKVVYLCPRQNVTFEPSTRMLTNNFNLAGYSGNAFSSTGATVLDMRVLLGSNFPSQGTPKGYIFHLNAKDSGSAASTTAQVQVIEPGANQVYEPYLNLAGTPNNTLVGMTGNVIADSSGNISFRCLASGTNTLTVYLAISGYFM